MRVVAGGGARLAGKPPTTHVRRKGISGNRERYDAKRRKSPRSEDTLDYMAILATDPCAFCGRPATANKNGISDRDHIVPLNAGGLDQWTNMVASCAACNRGRKDASLLTFMDRRNRRAACA